MSSKKAPRFKHKKGVSSSNKCKSRTIESSDDVPVPPCILQEDVAVNIEEDLDDDYAPILHLKRRKTNPSQCQMRNRTNTTVSQKTAVVITLSIYSNTESVFVESAGGDSTPTESQEDLIGSERPKVSRASQIHHFKPEEFRSIIDFVIKHLIDLTNCRAIL